MASTLLRLTFPSFQTGRHSIDPYLSVCCQVWASLWTLIDLSYSGSLDSSASMATYANSLQQINPSLSMLYICTYTHICIHLYAHRDAYTYMLYTNIWYYVCVCVSMSLLLLVFLLLSLWRSLTHYTKGQSPGKHDKLEKIQEFRCNTTLESQTCQNKAR